MANQKGHAARAPLPAITIDRPAKVRLKGENLQTLRLHQKKNR